MEMTILDTNFDVVYFLDQYESILWVDKFYEPGTFELYTPITEGILKYAKADYYMRNPDSDHLMIIEDISIESDSESGDHLKVVGRSLESILDRRILWGKVNFKNTPLPQVIERLLNITMISPSMADRIIPNFLPFSPTDYDDTKIASIKITQEYYGDNLLEVISTLCKENEVGYKLILNDENEFVFSLYTGENRSYSQNKNSYITFSENFDNLIKSDYKDKNSQYKNVAFVAGEENDGNRKTKAVGVSTGLYRREMYIDAGDIKQEGHSTSSYMILLEKRGAEKLGETNKKREFDGKCETSKPYTYGTDFFMGDIVEIANEYGIEAAATITEFTWSYSSSGLETYPTFVAIEESIITGKNKLTTTLQFLQDNNTLGEWDDNVYAYSDLVFTINLDAYDRVVGITIDGKNSLNTDIVFSLGNIVAPSGDLILSGCTDGSSSTYRISQYDNGTEKAINYNGDTIITALDKTHSNDVRFTIKKTKTVDNLTLYPMVRLVTASNTFEPYDSTLQEDT